MSNLPGAEYSPRIVNGVIRWYAGDTFSLQLDFTIEDQDGLPVEIQPEDTVSVVFRNEMDKAVKEFEFTDVQNNTVTLIFDDSVTALFREGGYTYDIYYRGAERVTLINNGKVVVE